MTTTCPKCGQVEVPIRQQPWQDRAYLASHNAPANADGYVARCGNRQPVLKRRCEGSLAYISVSRPGQGEAYCPTCGQVVPTNSRGQYRPHQRRLDSSKKTC